MLAERALDVRDVERVLLEASVSYQPMIVSIRRDRVLACHDLTPGENGPARSRTSPGLLYRD